MNGAVMGVYRSVGGAGVGIVQSIVVVVEGVRLGTAPLDLGHVIRQHLQVN